MKRRELLGRLAAAAAAPAVAPSAVEQVPDPSLSWLDEGGRAFLLALAEVVLPSEIGTAGQARVVDAFVRWLRNYRPDAEMDHGYGFTGLRTTGAVPMAQDPRVMGLLNHEAALRVPGASFASAPVAVRRTVLEEVMRDGNTERLQARPSGMVIVDLMAFYFHSSAANDLCYRAAIGRDACRGLPGSEEPPSRF